MAVAEQVGLLEIDPETVRIDYGRSGRKVVIAENRAGDKFYRALNSGGRLIRDYAATLEPTDAARLIQMLNDARALRREGIQGYREVLETALDWYLKSLGKVESDMVLGVCAYPKRGRKEIRFVHWDIGVWQRLDNR